MKKTFLVLTTALALVLFTSCGSKPAQNENPAEESATEVVAEEPEVVEAVAEEAAPADEATEEPEVVEAVAEEAAPADEVTEEPKEETAKVEEDEPVFMVVDQMAVPPYDNNVLKERLTVSLKDIDPEASPCRVFVQFVVEKDATTSNYTIFRSKCENEKIDAMAIEKVKEVLPAFKEPGKQRGKPVRTKFTVPVTFK